MQIIRFTLQSMNFLKIPVVQENTFPPELPRVLAALQSNPGTALNLAMVPQYPEITYAGGCIN